MYCVEIYVGEAGEGYWMISREDARESRAIKHMRECVADGYSTRLTYSA